MLLINTLHYILVFWRNKGGQYIDKQTINAFTRQSSCSYADTSRNFGDVLNPGEGGTPILDLTGMLVVTFRG